MRETCYSFIQEQRTLNANFRSCITLKVFEFEQNGTAVSKSIKVVNFVRLNLLYVHCKALKCRMEEKIPHTPSYIFYQQVRKGWENNFRWINKNNWNCNFSVFCISHCALQPEISSASSRNTITVYVPLSFEIKTKTLIVKGSKDILY